MLLEDLRYIKTINTETTDAILFFITRQYNTYPLKNVYQNEKSTFNPNCAGVEVPFPLQTQKLHSSEQPRQEEIIVLAFPVKS